MLDIFVCEDQDSQRQRIVEIIGDIVLMEELDMRLAFDTKDPYALLEQVKASPPIQN